MNWAVLVIDGDPTVEGEQRRPWNSKTQREWSLDNVADIESLEEGTTLFRGNIAFYLEER
jgi:hypothetical protein